MNIVILDAYTANPGDLSWEKLAKLGALQVYDRTPDDLILARAEEAEIVLINDIPLKRETIERLPKLKYIGVLSTGVNTVDLEAAAEKGVVVTNVPDYSSVSVAQHTLALLLALTSHVQYHSDTVKKGKWCLSKDFCYWDYAIEELADKTMGLIGFGNIGQRVAKIAQALGMKIIVYRSNSKPEELEMLFRESDVISLHCPLNQETVKIINAASLAKMKKSVFLINTSRGGLINEQDLANALNEGQIAGAGLDVLVKEPASVDTPLLKAKNCVITPHIAWASVESRARLIAIVTANVEAFLKGSLQNVI